ncbi:MAG: MFS transporter [Candidatus Dormiibacterota bacterium]
MSGITLTGSRAAGRGGARRWVLVSIVLAGAIINYFDRSNLSIAAPFVNRRFGLDPFEQGLLLSAFAWSYAVFNLPAGWLVDRFGPRRMLAGAVSLWSLISMATPFVPTYGLFLGMRGLLGLAESPFFASGLKMARIWFVPAQRGTATSVFNTGSQLASVLGPPILTVLMLAFGWQSMFVIVGAAGLVIAGLWVAVYRSRTAEVSRDNGQEGGGADDEATGPGVAWGRLLLQRSTWGMILGDFGLIYVSWVFVTWLPTYLERTRGLSILHSGFVAAIPFLAASVGVVVGGILSDRLIKAGLRPIPARKASIVAFAVLIPFAVIPAVLVPQVWLSVALIALTLFLAAAPSGVIWTLAADVAPGPNVASLGAIQNFGGYLGGALAPLLTGLVLQSSGSFTGAFVLAAGAAWLGAASYLFILRGPIQVPAAQRPVS